MNEKRLVVRFFPSNSSENRYIDLNVAAVERVGNSIVSPVPTISTFIRNPIQYIFKQQVDVTVLNWMENTLKGVDGKFSVTGLIKYFAEFLFFRFTSRKVYYIRHNIFPHEMSGKGAKMAKFFADLVERGCTKKIALSGHLESKNYFYLPHPLYSVLENQSEVYKTAYGEYFLIFGRITRYKNIESVISGWKSSTCLVIAGPSNDAVYLAELRQVAIGKSVHFIPNYLPELQSQALVSNSLGVLLAHADENVIVSGSFFYAISLGVPVIAVTTPFFQWLSNNYLFVGLLTVDSSDAIPALLDNLDYAGVCRDEIRAQSEELFGFEKVVEAWRRLLIGIN